MSLSASSPSPSIDPAVILAERFSSAIALAFPALAADPAAPSDPSVSPTKAIPGKPRFGDFQCNAAMALGKHVGQPPRAVAEQIVAKLDLGDIADPLTPASIAGPGFINITLRSDALGALLTKMNTPTLGIEQTPGAERETIVVDLCGVNLAKQMHVGHLRSTVIGDTLARVFARLGANVIRQNHVGDWGLPIAMVIRRLLDEQDAGRFDARTLIIDALEAHYRAAQTACDADPESMAYVKRWFMGPKIIAELEATMAEPMANLTRARETLVALQRSEPAVLAMWKVVVDVTMKSCYDNCARLNSIVLPEHDAGESMYRDKLAGVITDLESRGVATIDDGALVVRPEGLDPLLIRKRDGGFLYATTDLAAIRHRVGTLGASRVVYCVDARQSLHFKQVFAAAHMAGYDALKPPLATHLDGCATLLHAAFGAILGEDGRPFKTRSGESFKLADLLDEAHERALGKLKPETLALPPKERDEIVHAVAVSAIRYADLSSERIKDYVFNLDRMLAFEGNTGPYLLYALVRCHRLFHVAAERGITVDPTAPIVVKEPTEKTLALALLAYSGAVRTTAQTLLPSRLCQYVYDLAGAFSSFYDACPTLVAPDEPTRQSRLALTALTRRVLADGLTLLGIPTVEMM